jgi:hypothetical protein
LSSLGKKEFVVGVPATGSEAAARSRAARFEALRQGAREGALRMPRMTRCQRANRLRQRAETPRKALVSRGCSVDMPGAQRA